MIVKKVIQYGRIKLSIYMGTNWKKTAFWQICQYQGE
jgi:hypothetical protein